MCVFWDIGLCSDSDWLDMYEAGAVSCAGDWTCDLSMCSPASLSSKQSYHPEPAWMKLDVWLHMQNESRDSVLSYSPVKGIYIENVFMTASVKRHSGSLHPAGNRFSFLSPAGTSSHFHCHLVKERRAFKCCICQNGEMNVKEMDEYKSWSSDLVFACVHLALKSPQPSAIKWSSNHSLLL